MGEDHGHVHERAYSVEDEILKAKQEDARKDVEASEAKNHI